MPLYAFACSQGHETTRFYRVNDVRPARVRCGQCRRRARRVFSLAGVQDDFPEHYNISMGCVVKNRRHHRQLQKELGLQDWEPRRETRETERLRREGVL